MIEQILSIDRLLQRAKVRGRKAFDRLQCSGLSGRPWEGPGIDMNGFTIGGTHL